VHGVCDIHLNTKPSYETLKNICSPIIVKKVSHKEGKIMLTLAGKLGLPSYCIRNYFINAGKQKLQIIELKPGEEKTFEIKTDADEIGIYRSTGFQVMHLNLR
jgi:beta-glucuronidase